MKIKKLISMGLAAIMAVSAISMTALAADETTYSDSEDVICTSADGTLENSKHAIFVTEDGELKQVTPLVDTASNIEDLSVVIDNNKIIVTDKDNEVVQVSELAFTPSDGTNSEGFLYSEYRVTGNNVNMWNYPNRTYVVLTLEYGVHFWSKTIAGTASYMHGYVLSDGSKIYGMVSASYLAAV